MVAAMSLPPALRRGDLSEVADGITKLRDSENSGIRTALASLQSGSCQKGRDGVVLTRRSLVLAGLEGAPWC